MASRPADYHEIKARAWMDENPEAMSVFERLALEAARRGKKFGIGLLTERVRWEMQVLKHCPESEGFAVNNNHRATIARELLRRHPFLIHHIEFRHAGTEGVPSVCPVAAPAAPAPLLSLMEAM